MNEINEMDEIESRAVSLPPICRFDIGHFHGKINISYLDSKVLQEWKRKTEKGSR